MNLIILTPSICRPDLHNINFPDIINCINKSNIFENIHHFINIDNCQGISKFSQEDTKNNFIKLYKDTRIKLDIYLTDKPCFFNAIKNLVNNCNNYITNNTVILYLEDDWKLIKDFDIDNIIKNLYDENIYIGLANKKNKIERIKSIKLKFKPSIWGINTYENFFKKSILSQKTNNDPEVIVLKYIEKYSKNNNIQIDCYVRNYFNDIGRLWQKKNKKIRWNRWKETKNITYIN